MVKDGTKAAGNKSMARGWESKSVESQIEDSRNTRNGEHRGISRVEVEHRHKLESLEISRSRIARELETAQSPSHRSALENAIAHLDSEIQKLGEPPARKPAPTKPPARSSK